MSTGPMTSEQEALIERITTYLSTGGLVNPELADHVAVRDLLIECRAAPAGSAQPANTDGIPSRGLIQETASGVSSPHHNAPNTDSVDPVGAVSPAPDALVSGLESVPRDDVHDKIMGLVQEFGDAMLRRGIVAQHGGRSGSRFEHAFKESAQRKDAVATALRASLAASLPASSPSSSASVGSTGSGT